MPVRNYSIRFPADQFALIEAAAKERGYTPTAYIRLAVDRLLSEKNPEREIDELKATAQATYLTLHELAKDLYVRIPPPPDSVRALAEQDGRTALKDNLARVGAIMSERNGCKK